MMRLNLLLRKLGASTIKRSWKLALDDIILDPVIYDVAKLKKSLVKLFFDFVITVQTNFTTIKNWNNWWNNRKLSDNSNDYYN